MRRAVLRIAPFLTLAIAVAVFGALPLQAGPPLPPVVLNASPTELTAPTTTGDAYTGTFTIAGKFFDGGEIYTDGPILLTGSSTVKKLYGAQTIGRDFEIGCCVPRDEWIGRTFHLFVVTPYGQKTVDVNIVAQP